MTKRFFGALAALIFAASLAHAADVLPNVGGDSGPVESTPVILIKPDGTPYEASGGGGGGAATIADGADVTQGAVADAAVAAGAAGTEAAKLRRLTTDLSAMSAKLPAALGGTTASASLPVVLSSDGPFATQTGSVTETAPATDTASSGLNGRLQRIAQRLTTVNTTLGTPLQAGGAVGLAAATTGGCTLGKTLSAASTNATSVKGSAGTLCSLTVINTTATLYYLKFYDKAIAATCNSDTVLQTIPVPASATGAGVAVPTGPFGWAFPTGITFCLTAGIADNDNANAATGVAINYSYK